MPLRPVVVPIVEIEARSQGEKHLGGVTGLPGFLRVDNASTSGHDLHETDDFFIVSVPKVLLSR